jgi:hypothetical protein
MKEEDLRAMLVYPPFRARYNQSRKAFSVMRVALGYPEAPALADVLVTDFNIQNIRGQR